MPCAAPHFFQPIRQVVGGGAEHGRGVGLVLGDAYGRREGAVGAQAGDQIAADVNDRRNDGDAALAAKGHGRLDTLERGSRADADRRVTETCMIRLLLEFGSRRDESRRRFVAPAIARRRTRGVLFGRPRTAVANDRERPFAQNAKGLTPIPRLTTRLTGTRRSSDARSRRCPCRLGSRPMCGSEGPENRCSRRRRFRSGCPTDRRNRSSGRG